MLSPIRIREEHEKHGEAQDQHVHPHHHDDVRHVATQRVNPWEGRVSCEMWRLETN